MHGKIKEKFSLNYGWENCWWDPEISKSIQVNQIIKGPFAKPKLADFVPYVTVCQQDGSAIRLTEGVPDCWTEYLSHCLRLFRNHKLMHTEDVDIVPQLRKYYRLYLGPGIPNPWTPYINDLDTFSQEILENLERHSHCLPYCQINKNNFMKKHCVCCTRKYLFKCPDSCDSHSSCSLKNCYGINAPAINCCKKYRNIKVLPNRILKKTNLKHRKIKPRKEVSECGSSSPTESSSQEKYEGENLNKNESQNYRNKFFKEQSKKCSCPYIKNFCLKKTPLKNSKDNCDLKPPVFVSKLIQAEVQPSKRSKSVQTDNPKTQYCTKCFWCNIFQCNSPWNVSCKQGNPAGGCEIGCPPISSAPSFCYCAQNPAFVCPCSFSNHVITYKPHKEKSNGLKKQYKQKQLKERNSEDDLNAEFRPNPTQIKANEEAESYMKWDNTEQGLIKPNYDVFSSDKNIYSCSKLTKTFDHMKFLTDDKLKHYLQRESVSPITRTKFINQSPFSGFKQTDFEKGNTTFSNPARVQLERFKYFSHSTPEHFKPIYMERKISPRESKKTFKEDLNFLRRWLKSSNPKKIC